MERSVRIQMFVKSIWRWYSVNKRLLPWRDLPDADPATRAYKVMVSEIMLQQTQVSRVKIVFKDFLGRFPSLHDLAQASNKDVLLAWRGMGYNARAIRLRDAARAVDSQFAGLLVCSKDATSKQANKQTGMFPCSMEELQSIPGIGRYTAAAIRNFAFNIPTSCLDTNIRRILHRTFVGPENADGTWKKDDQYLLKIAEEILKVAASSGRNHDAANWHAALMDFGALIQTKNNPRWDLCPLTAKGIMKTSPEAFARTKNRTLPVRTARPGRRMARPNGRQAGRANGKSSEPGRLVGAKYIPNRIFRGKVIEELRDAAEGLKLDMIGRRVCIDWSPAVHREWLKGIVEKLVAERMISASGGRYRLFE